MPGFTIAGVPPGVGDGVGVGVGVDVETLFPFAPGAVLFPFEPEIVLLPFAPGAVLFPLDGAVAVFPCPTPTVPPYCCITEMPSVVELGVEFPACNPPQVSVSRAAPESTPVYFIFIVQRVSASAYGADVSLFHPSPHEKIRSRVFS